MLVNQHCALSLTCGKDSQAYLYKPGFPLARHLLKRKMMGKLAKENIRRLIWAQFRSLSIYLYPHYRLRKEEGLHTGSAGRGPIRSL